MKYVFIPGMLCDERQWASQIQLLKDCGIHDKDIFIADVTQDVSVKAMGDRLLNEVEGELCLIGFSLGTLVAYEVLKVAPKRVKKLVLDSSVCGSVPSVALGGLFEAIRSANNNFENYLEEFFPRYLASGGVNYDETKKTFMAMAKSLGKDVCLRQLNALIAANTTKNELSHIHCPTLIIGGDKDRRTVPAGEEELARIIHGAKLVMLKGIEHFVTLQAPDEVNSILKEWLFD